MTRQEYDARTSNYVRYFGSMWCKDQRSGGMLAQLTGVAADDGDALVVTFRFVDTGDRHDNCHIMHLQPATDEDAVVSLLVF